MASTHQVPLDVAGIASTVAEGILYGISVVMFGVTIWVIFTRSRNRPNRLMAAVALSLLICSTAHIIIDVIRIEEGLVYQRDSFPGGPVNFFLDVTQPTFAWKNIVYSIQTLLGDGMVIYRCFVVWQSVWIIVLPCMLWCSVLATAAGSVYSVSHSSTNVNIFAVETGRWITSFYASTLATNLTATGLLAFRLWSLDKQVAHHRQGAGILKPLFLVSLDTGLLYSATLFSALMCFVFKSNGQYVVLDLVTPIISIAFCMVIIRMGLVQAQPSLRGYGSSQNTSAGGSSGRSGPRIPLKDLKVHVSNLTDVTVDSDVGKHPDRSRDIDVESLQQKASRG